MLTTSWIVFLPALGMAAGRVRVTITNVCGEWAPTNSLHIFDDGVVDTFVRKVLLCPTQFSP